MARVTRLQHLALTEQEQALSASRAPQQQKSLPNTSFTMVPRIANDTTPNLTYEALHELLPKLSPNSQALAVTILQGSDSMDPSHIDMLGRYGGIRWWSVSPDGTKRLYWECFQLCRTEPDIYNMVAAEVRNMIDELTATNHIIRYRAAKITLAKAIEQDEEERASACTGPGTILTGKEFLTPHAAQGAQEMAIFLHRRSQGLNTSCAELYDRSPLESSAQKPSFKRKHSTLESAANVTEDEIGFDQTRDPQHESSLGLHEQNDSNASKILSKRRKPSKVRVTDLESFHLEEEQHESDVTLKKQKREKKDGDLDPGKKFYHWTEGRVHVARQLLGLSDHELPESALLGAFHDLESYCTSATTNIGLCTFDISIEEILTYFPLHTLWREVCWRVIQHWSASKVVEFIYWTRDLKNKKVFQRSTLQHQYKRARTWAEETLKERQKAAAQAVHVAPEVLTPPTTLAGVEGPKIKGNMSAVSHSSGLTGCHKVKPFDYPVFHLAQGVQQDRHPTGKGAQLLTRVVQHVLENDNRGTFLSEVSSYAQKHAITVPQDSQLVGDSIDEDKAALARHSKEIGKFYFGRFGHSPI